MQNHRTEECFLRSLLGMLRSNPLRSSTCGKVYKPSVTLLIGMVKDLREGSQGVVFEGGDSTPLVISTRDPEQMKLLRASPETRVLLASIMANPGQFGAAALTEILRDLKLPNVPGPWRFTEQYFTEDHGAYEKLYEMTVLYSLFDDSVIAGARLQYRGIQAKDGLELTVALIENEMVRDRQFTHRVLTLLPKVSVVVDDEVFSRYTTFLVDRPSHLFHVNYYERTVQWCRDASRPTVGELALVNATFENRDDESLHVKTLNYHETTTVKLWQDNTSYRWDLSRGRLAGNILAPSIDIRKMRGIYVVDFGRDERGLRMTNQGPEHAVAYFEPKTLPDEKVFKRGLLQRLYDLVTRL